MTRLCIYAARLKLHADPCSEERQIQNIDGVALLRSVNDKAAELLKCGNINRILDFLKEG